MCGKNHRRIRLMHYLMRFSRCQDEDKVVEEWESMYIYKAMRVPVDGVLLPGGYNQPNVHYEINKASTNDWVGIDCPCSQPNLMRLCYIRNKITHHIVIVGCCCVGNFLSMSVPIAFFAVLDKMCLQIPVVPTDAMLRALPPFVLTDYERKFLHDRHRKKEKISQLTDKQRVFLIRVNMKILSQVHRWHLEQTNPRFALLSPKQKSAKVSQFIRQAAASLIRIKEARQRKKKQLNSVT